jgi:hypothetical protein
MKRGLTRGLLVLAFAVLVTRPEHTTGQQVPYPTEPGEKKYEDFDKVTKGAKEYDGLFKLHLKEDRLYAEIRPDQFDKPFLLPIAIARGLGMGGHTLNFDEQWVVMFKRVGDRVQLIRRNVHFTAKPGSPAAKAVETTYTDSVLLAMRIQSINPIRQSVLVNLNDVFMQDFADLGLGMFDTTRSTWTKIKAFPRNIELEVTATFAARGGRRFGDDSVIDPRGTTVVIHYSLCQLPEPGYQPRLADDRVGYFLSVVKDFSSDSQDTSFLRYINRWRLERAEPLDPKHPEKLSAPKKKIVFWIEKSVPDEYRAAVREGILEWNKAFEKVGFRDAIEVRQQENEDFDPEDVNYNTFRWITTDRGFAMGPSRANPMTGELIDADIIFDASMVRYWRSEVSLYGGASEPASLIQASKLGYGLNLAMPGGSGEDAKDGWRDMAQSDVASLQQRLLAARHGLCQCGQQMKYEMGLAAMALAARGTLKPGDKVPEEFIQQAVKEVVMHEVGHTLGLRHNFKGSSMLKNDQLNDLNITRKQGLTGSVMDYTATNIAPKGVKQGDYFTTTIGPYDYWAIEYAYRPLTGGTEGEYEKLQEIAKKCAERGLDYATDEDLYSGSDPLVNAWDLGSDPMRFAQDRILLAEELLKNLSDKAVDNGEGYQRTRQAFGILLGQYGNGAHLVSNYIGGEHMHRDHRGDPGGRDPFVPVKGDKQREALKFLQDHILSDKSFQFSPQLLRRLAADRWSHWGNDRAVMQPVDYPVYDRVLNVQRVALGQLLDPAVLSRVQNNALKADKDDKPLTVAEIFRGLTDGIWKMELAEKEGKKSLASSVVRRNLQREYVKELSAIVVGTRGRSAMPPDARSLARMHLRDIAKRIDKVLEAQGDDANPTLDDTTRAHLEECKERIAKTLGASVQVNEP